MISKWRGIPTTSIKKNEDQPKTITNRLGQLSFSMPRIDDKKRWAGFPGLAGTARKIASLIIKDKYFCYIEPFAGTAKVYQELTRWSPTIPKAILNDKSEFIYNWLKYIFQLRNVHVTKIDFKQCMEYFDEKGTFFLIDPPWFKTYYEQSFSCFDRKDVKSYDQEILDLCKKLKGDFMITTRKENKIMVKSGFNNYLVTSEYVVCGKYPKVLITTNLKIKSKLAVKI